MERIQCQAAVWKLKPGHRRLLGRQHYDVIRCSRRAARSSERCWQHPVGVTPGFADLRGANLQDADLRGDDQVGAN